ncbi:hypothetical protein BD410DRAFT_781492 [Rickenella mellea]|uniref:Micro-fibrillar-associated protein 1 C-terminal domain-containing protein n=1 Tax=Rickenella mellea TaxID=50990 RepID=A0A4Y7QMQ7_9AGAM|nr:hypothetical protein BD410DRAFT_781492 [Rickenella mellea]
MSSTTARKAAPRPARPAARYWRGKAPTGVTEVGSDSESDASQDGEPQENGDVPVGDEDEDEEDDGGIIVKETSKAQASKTMNIALKNVDISKEGKVIVSGREESGKTLMEDEEESEEEESVPVVKAPGAASDESSEYESDSEAEEASKPMFRPVFVPKRGRITVLEREQEAADSEEALRKKEAAEEERRQQSHDLVAESIKRELLEKEKEDEQPDLDDTDGIDPTAEFEAWRLRELERIKRDKEEQMKREKEREEVERRRALPEDVRLKEDLEHAQESRDAKPKGQQKFLQKYWHKGAFHQDAEILKKHDFTAPTESTIDVTLLPKVMQVKNFGKRSQTKYTHLVDQDTTVGNGGFGGAKILNKPGMKPGDLGSGCFVCGGPHLKKDCPQNQGPLQSGANNSSMAGSSRQWGRETDVPNIRDNPPRDRDRRSERSPDRKAFHSDARGSGRRDEYDERRQRDDEPPNMGRRYRVSDDDRYNGRQRSRSRSPHREIRRERQDSHRDRRHSRDRSPDDGRGEKRRRTD